MYFAQADYFSKVSCSKVLIFGQLFLAYLDVQKTVAFHTDGNRKEHPRHDMVAPSINPREAAYGSW